MWGHYRQNITAVDANRAKPGLTGSAWYLGSATAFDLSSDQLGTANDFVAAMHLIGPAVDGTVFRDRWTFRAVADLNPDFAMVRPFALRDVPTGVARAGMSRPCRAVTITTRLACIPPPDWRPPTAKHARAWG